MPFAPTSRSAKKRPPVFGEMNTGGGFGPPPLGMSVPPAQQSPSQTQVAASPSRNQYSADGGYKTPEAMALSARPNPIVLPPPPPRPRPIHDSFYGSGYQHVTPTPGRQTVAESYSSGNNPTNEQGFFSAQGDLPPVGLQPRLTTFGLPSDSGMFPPNRFGTPPAPAQPVTARPNPPQFLPPPPPQQAGPSPETPQAPAGVSPPAMIPNRASEMYKAQQAAPPTMPNIGLAGMATGPRALGPDLAARRGAITTATMGDLPHGVNQMGALNDAIRERGPQPYNPDPLGYASALQNGGGIFTNQDAQTYQANTGMMPRVTAGGAFGQPTPNITEQDLARARQIGIQGNAREAMLGALNKRPTGYQPPPMRDMAQKPQFPTSSYSTDSSGSIFGNADVQKRVDAAKQANSAAATERQKYLQGRADAKKERMKEVTAKAKIKGEARAYSARAGRGQWIRGQWYGRPQLTLDERAANANPTAYQGRKAMEARLNGEQLMADKRLGLAKEQMQSAEKVGLDRNQKMVDAANARSAAEQGPQPKFPVPKSAAGRLDPPEYKRIASLGDRDQARNELRANGYTDDREIEAVLDDMFGKPKNAWGEYETPSVAGAPTAPPSPGLAPAPPKKKLPPRKNPSQTPAQWGSEHYGVGSGYAF